MDNKEVGEEASGDGVWVVPRRSNDRRCIVAMDDSEEKEPSGVEKNRDGNVDSSRGVAVVTVESFRW